MLRSLLALTLILACSSVRADLVISQYYEGASNNKWIELVNTGATSFDLSTVSLSLWSNANTEAYKTNGTPTQIAALSGTLASGGVYLIAHASAVLPSYATPNATNNFIINFNGDDSVVLSLGAAFTTASILDAIGFTDAANAGAGEGANNSFVRTSTAAGWSTTAGSNATSFPSVWTQVTNAAVDGAATGTNERLGFSTLPVAVPEASSFLFGGLIACAAGLKCFGRRKSA
jgi:predicted extracellular nuclease